MTKAKKKMTKSTFVIIIMAVAMVAMLAFGGTFAYFTATADTKSGSTKTGVITLSTNNTTITISKQDILPHEALLTTEEAKDITYDTTNATRAQVAFFTFTVEIKKDNTPVEGASLIITPPSTGAFANAVVMTTGEGIVNSDTAKTVAILIPAATESINMTGLKVSFDATAESDNGEIPTLMGATITITIEAESIQAVQADGTEITTLNATNAGERWAALNPPAAG